MAATTHVTSGSSRAAASGSFVILPAATRANPVRATAPGTAPITSATAGPRPSCRSMIVSVAGSTAGEASITPPARGPTSTPISPATTDIAVPKTKRQTRALNGISRSARKSTANSWSSSEPPAEPASSPVFCWPRPGPPAGPPPQTRPGRAARQREAHRHADRNPDGPQHSRSQDGAPAAHRRYGGPGGHGERDRTGDHPVGGLASRAIPLDQGDHQQIGQRHRGRDAEDAREPLRLEHLADDCEQGNEQTAINCLDADEPRSGHWRILVRAVGRGPTDTGAPTPRPLGKGRELLISTLIAGHDGDIPHLVSPRLVDGCQPGSRRRPPARRRAALPAAGLERPPPGAGPPRRRRGGLGGRPPLAA